MSSVIRSDRLGSGDFLRGTIDDAIRRHKWGAIEVQMGRCRVEHYQEKHKLGKRAQLLGKMVDNRTENEIRKG